MSGLGGLCWFNDLDSNAVGVDPDRVVAVTEGRHIVDFKVAACVLYLEGGKTITVAGSLGETLRTLRALGRMEP